MTLRHDGVGVNGHSSFGTPSDEPWSVRRLLRGLFAAPIQSLSRSPRSQRQGRLAVIETLEQRMLLSTTLVWNGQSGQNWDTNSAHKYWLDGSTAVAWVNGDDAIFSGGGIASVTISGTVTANSLTFNASGYTISGGTNLTLAGTGSIVANANATINSKISGSVGLAKGGAGVLTLSGTTSNNYTGSTTVSAGTLRMGGSSTLGASGGNLTVMTIATLDLNGTNQTVATLSGNGTIVNNGNGTSILTVNGANVTSTYNGVISNGPSGNGLIALSKTGTGTLVLSGANAYSGGTTLGSGTLQLAGVSALGASTGMLTVNSGVLDLNGFSPTVGGLAGSGGKIANNANGTTSTLTVSSGSGSFSGMLVDFSGTSGGTLSLVKSGNGTLALLGANTYSGMTTVAQGVLQIGNNGTVGSLGSGNVNLTDVSATLNFNRSNQMTLTNVISGVGNLRLDGWGTLILAAVNSYSGNTIINGTLQVGNATVAGGLGAGSIVDNGNLIIKNTGLNPYYLANDISGSGSLTQSQNALVILTGNNTYSGSTTISSGTLQVGNGGVQGSMGSGGIVDNAALVLDRSDSVTLANVISGNGSLTQMGTGTVILTAANSYTGGTALAVGTLRQQNAAALGTVSNNLTINSGVLDLNGFNLTVQALNGLGGTITNNSGTVGVTLTIGDSNMGGTFSGTIADGTQTIALTKTGSGTEVLAGTESYSGATTISGGSLQFGGSTTISNNFTLNSSAALCLSSSGVSTFTGTISGTGNVTISGPGMVIFAGTYTYCGATTVSSGTLQLQGNGTLGTPGNALTINGGYLDLNGISQTVGAFNGDGGGQVVNSNVTDVTLTFGDNNGPETNSSTIKDLGFGQLSLVKIGTNVQILAGNNNYNGTTTINGGILQFGNGGSAGTPGSSDISIAANSTLIFNRKNNLTVDNIISGGGSLAQQGTNTLILTADNTYSGGTTISSGAITIKSDASLGDPAGELAFIGSGTLRSGKNNIKVSPDREISIASGVTATFDSDDYDFTVAGLIGGDGGIAKVGTGTLYLRAGNQYAGGTTITQGVLFNTDDSELGASTGTVTLNGGTWLLDGDNGTIARDITLLNNPAAANTINIDNGAHVILTGTISGGGGLDVNGKGWLTLAADNPYSGRTTIDNGALEISGSIANSDVTINANGTFSLTPESNSAGTSSQPQMMSLAAASNNSSTGSSGSQVKSITNNGGEQTTVQLWHVAMDDEHRMEDPNAGIPGLENLASAGPDAINVGTDKDGNSKDFVSAPGEVQAVYQAINWKNPDRAFAQVIYRKIPQTYFFCNDFMVGKGGEGAIITLMYLIDCPMHIDTWIWDVKVDQVVLQSMKVTSSDSDNNSVQGGDLWVEDSESGGSNSPGTATVKLKPNFTPKDKDVPGTSSHILYTVTPVGGGSADPDHGDFSGAGDDKTLAITLDDDGGNVFDIAAGVDNNKNDVLDPDEVTTTTRVHLVHLMGMSVTDKTNNHELDIDVPVDERDFYAVTNGAGVATVDLSEWLMISGDGDDHVVYHVTANNNDVQSGNFGGGAQTIELDTTGGNYEFVAKVGFATNGVTTWQEGDDMSFTANIHVIDLRSLTATSDVNSNNWGRDSGPAVPPDPKHSQNLYVEEQDDGTAVVDTAVDFAPHSRADHVFWALYAGNDTSGEPIKSQDMTDDMPPLTLAAADSRDYVLVAGVDINDDGQFDKDEISRMVDIHVVKIDSIMVANSAHFKNNLELKTPNSEDFSGPTLYVGMDDSRTADIDLSAIFKPMTSGAGGHVVWQLHSYFIDEQTGTTVDQTGTFNGDGTAIADADGTTGPLHLTPPLNNTSYYLSVGFDTDGSGDWSGADHVDFHMNVVLVRIDWLQLIETTNPGYSLGRVTADSTASVQLYLAQNGAGKATADMNAQMDVSYIPSNYPDALPKFLWTVNGQTPTPNKGTFATIVPYQGFISTLTFAPIDDDHRTFTVQAGFDYNGDGKLDGDEVSRTINVTVVKVDLLMDTNNDGSITDADESGKDDPSQPGKIIIASTLDSDGDSVPDFAAGLGFGGSAPSFAQLKLTLSKNIDPSKAAIQFHYSSADPANITVNNSGGITTYEPGSSNPITIWTKDGPISRGEGAVDGASYFPSDFGDFVPASRMFSASYILDASSHTVTLYVEGINASNVGDVEIEVDVDPDGSKRSIVHDAVRLTVASLQLVYTDASGLSHKDSVPLEVSRIAPNKQTDGVATDWQDGVDDGSTLLVRAVGSPILRTLVDQGKLHVDFGMVGTSIDLSSNGSAFWQLPNSGYEGYYKSLDDNSFVDDAATTLQNLGVQTIIGHHLEDDIANVNYNRGLILLGETFYRPPNEFDMVKGPGDQANSRHVALAVSVSGAVQYAGAKPNAITLVRPPLVLVHGINAQPAKDGAKGYWSDFTPIMKQDGYITFLADHSGVDNYAGGPDNSSQGYMYGCGELTDVYLVVPQTIDQALSDFRSGVSFKDINVAVQKVDVVAHSYGGVLTRWYLEQAAVGGEYAGSLFDTRRDVRKLIELGTPNLGSPLANMVDEATSNPLIGNAVIKNDQRVLDTLKVFFGVTLGLPGYIVNSYVTSSMTLSNMLWLLNYANPINLQAGLKVFSDSGNLLPFYQDVAVDSELLDLLNAVPFNPDVAYGAIQGTTNTLFGANGINLYSAFQPMVGGINIFPWFYELDGVNSDGVVPQWSSALGLRTVQVSSADHTLLPWNSDVATYVNDWLNGFNRSRIGVAPVADPMPLGLAQRAAWHNTAPVSDQNAYWKDSHFTGGVASGAGLNPDALVRVELNGTDSSPVCWDTTSMDANGVLTGLGIHHPVLTGMMPYRQLQAGCQVQLCSLIVGGYVALDAATIKLGDAGISVDASYLVGAGPDDLIPFRITALRMGRTVDGEPTGFLGASTNVVSRDYYISYSLDAGTTYSASTCLTLPAYTGPLSPIVISDDPAGAINIQLNGCFSVTDKTASSSPTSYWIELLDNLPYFADVFYDVTVTAAAEPADAWDGLALQYSRLVVLQHDGSGRILTATGGALVGPIWTCNWFYQSSVTPWIGKYSELTQII